MMKRLDVHLPNPRLASRGFPGGSQQTAAIARETGAREKVLLIGQRTRGADIAAIEFIRGQSTALKEHGCAIVLVSVGPDESSAVSDRVRVLNAGQIAGSAPRAGADHRMPGVKTADAA